MEGAGNRSYFKVGVEGVIDRDSLTSHLLEVESRPEDNEIEKTPEQVEEINQLIAMVAEIAKKYGADNSIAITEKIIHIVPFESLPEANDTYAGGCVNGMQKIILRPIKSEYFRKTVIHELLHVFSHIKVRMKFTKPNRIDATKYRMGLLVSSSVSTSGSLGRDRFHALNEAVTEFLSNELLAKIPNEKINWEVGYNWLASFLPDVCKKIFELAPGLYSNENEVREYFLRAYFSGKITDLKPLLDKLGKDCFAELSALSADYNLDGIRSVVDFCHKYGLPDDTELNNEYMHLIFKKDHLAEKKLIKQARERRKRIVV